ncbi:hypothetical protein [Streptomyces sp. NPDC055210]
MAPDPEELPDLRPHHRAQKKLGWWPKTSHWPSWSLTGHRGRYDHPHCWCAGCMGLHQRVGATKTLTNEDGRSVPASAATGIFSPLTATGQDDVERGERPLA